MKIGIDIDEIITEYVESIIEFYKNKTGRTLLREDFKTYHFWETWGGTRKEAIQIVEEFFNSELFDSIKPVKDSIQSINNLSKNNELIFITSRPDHWKEKTEDWLKRNLDSPVKVIFTSDFHTGEGKKKAEICRELKSGLILEDNEKYAIECANTGIKVILFDKPWNQNSEHSNLIRVNDWTDALKEIENFSKNT